MARRLIDTGHGFPLYDDEPENAELPWLDVRSDEQKAADARAHRLRSGRYAVAPKRRLPDDTALFTAAWQARQDGSDDTHAIVTGGLAPDEATARALARAWTRDLFLTRRTEERALHLAALTLDSYARTHSTLETR